MTKRWLPVLVLAGFMTYTGIFIFVYLFRAFRAPEPVAGEVVRIWHGDPFLRAVFVAVLFLIGLVALLAVSLMRWAPQQPGRVRLRPDIWEWLEEHSDETGEPAAAIAERAIASYRARMTYSVDDV